MTLQTWAWTFAAVFAVLGILGFVATAGGLFVGTFILGTGMSLVLLASGIVAAIAALISPETERLYFQVFGILFLLAAIVGFVQGTSVLGLFGVNFATSAFNLIVAAFALAIGFGVPKEKEREELVHRAA